MSDVKILSGKDTAQSVYHSLNNRVISLADKNIRPGLCVVLIGDDPASQIYVRTKTKKLRSLGLLSESILLPSDVKEKKVIKIINDLNNDSKYHGILVQFPLPGHITTQNIINSIKPEKDVDGFHPENVGWLSIGKPRFIPCTPKGIMRILDHYNIDLNGKNIVVIGRSNIVGRPISILTSLNSQGANGTCTICHSRTKNIEKFTINADVIITAIGSPNYLKGDMIKSGAVLIDVGINRVNSDNEKGYVIVGDVDWDSVLDKASFITPVPGGVGPMTIAMLVENTIEAAEKFG
jgi:methylenetetrahydrofolate dehydrogenase (NADP+)/methenyltetrahydrofolate cyclohydrolase